MWLRQAVYDTIVISMTPDQSRMARAALRWSLTDLSVAAGVGRATAARFELGQSVDEKSVEAMRGALVAAGILLIDAGKSSPAAGVGVRLAR